jgi:hypothetical protein
MASRILLSPGVRAKKKQETISDFLPGSAAGNGWYFCFHQKNRTGSDTTCRIEVSC